MLANVALHGFETAIAAVSRRYRIVVIRYADDFVILCEDLATLLEAQARAETWLAEMGLRLSSAKTHAIRKCPVVKPGRRLGVRVKSRCLAPVRS